MNYQQQSHIFPPVYSNLPGNSEVNWAQLAQRWIQTQHPQQAYQAVQPTNMPHPPPPPPPHPSSYPLARPQTLLFHGAPQPNIPSAPAGVYPTPLFNVPVRPPQNQWLRTNQQQWAQSPSAVGSSYSSSPGMMLPPPVLQYNYAASTHGINQKQDDEEYQAHYDPSLDQEDANDQKASDAPEGAMEHWMVDPWNTGMYPPNYIPIIDIQMRKKLPAWILEGLEKAEREKLKKQEKDAAEQKRKESEAELTRRRKEKGLGKFDDESDEEKSESTAKEEYRAVSDEPIPVTKFHEYVEESKIAECDDVSKEQSQEEAMLVMRRLMTNVLLEATNREIERIADEILTKEKMKGSQVTSRILGGPRGEPNYFVPSANLGRKR